MFTAPFLPDTVIQLSVDVHGRAPSDAAQVLLAVNGIGELTATPDTSGAFKASVSLDAGFDAYISKPFRSRELIEMVNSFVRKDGNGGDGEGRP